MSHALSALSAVCVFIVVVLAVNAMRRRKFQFSNVPIWVWLTFVTFILGLTLVAQTFAAREEASTAAILVQSALLMVAASVAAAAVMRAPQIFIADRTLSLTEDLKLTNDMLATALLKSPITVFSQDKDLRHTFVHNPPYGFEPDRILGKTDEEILPPAAAAKVIPLKRAAIERGEIGRAEVQVQQNGRPRWYDFTVEGLKDSKGELVGSVSVVYDITELKENQEKLVELMREVTHRSKNLLAITQSIARQTVARATSVEDYVTRFNGRLKALSDAHDILIKGDWAGAHVEDLLQSQLSSLSIERQARVTVSGGSVFLKPDAVQNMCLAVHELLANAVDYGALSTPDGRVDVKWIHEPPSANGGMAFQWREIGGPKVDAPDEAGFGSLMVETVLSKALNAETSLKFNPAGVECAIRIPADYIA